MITWPIVVALDWVAMETHVAMTQATPKYCIIYVDFHSYLVYLKRIFNLK